MKPDERDFLRLVAGKAACVSVRDLMGDMPHKRAVYILYKWARKGWYDYGVNVGLGWLTDAGRAAAQEAARG